jgi:modification methylase
MLLPLNKILHGDCIEVLSGLPDNSIDLIFADPPYNLQLKNDLHRPNMTLVDAVDDQWDKFESMHDYDNFTRQWLGQCKRVLKPSGTIWIIGSYHNIFRVGYIMQELGFWILNDVIWIKSNPMPNFRGVRFTNAHETLIWASTGDGKKYTFNHHAMKEFNEEKQMRSDWWILPLATGNERIKDNNGKKAHSTQKPEPLLYRIILSSSNPGDVVLDPFFGSGTTGAVAKTLHRKWIGIEKEEQYISVAQKRIDSIDIGLFDTQLYEVRSKKQIAPRLNFSTLVENLILIPGEKLYFNKNKNQIGMIKPDSKILLEDGFEGSIHKAGSHFMNGSPCNGWDHWFVERDGQVICIDEFRQKYLQEKGLI